MWPNFTQSAKAVANAVVNGVVWLSETKKHKLVTQTWSYAIFVTKKYYALNGKRRKQIIVVIVLSKAKNIEVRKLKSKKVSLTLLFSRS